MNELWQHLKKSDPEDWIAKKNLKEFEVTTYTNKVHIVFGGSIIGTPNLSVFLWCLTLVGEENKSPFIRVWKPSPSIHALKPWGEARQGKPKEDNIC